MKTIQNISNLIITKNVNLNMVGAHSAKKENNIQTRKTINSSIRKSVNQMTNILFLQHFAPISENLKKKYGYI